MYIWDIAGRVKITTLKEFHCFLLAFICVAMSAMLGLGDVKRTTFRHSASVLQVFFVLSNQAVNFTWGQ